MEVWAGADLWRRLWRLFCWRGARPWLALSSIFGLGWALGRPELSIPLMLGVIASALAETDDDWRGRLRGQWVALMSFSVMALAVQHVLAQPVGLLLVLAGGALGLTLLGALGERYRALAQATLILGLYTALALQPMPGQEAPDGLAVRLMLAGAAWYGVISVAVAALWPLLPVRQLLADVLEVLGEQLRLKSRLLEPVRGLDLERRRLAMALHNGRVVEALNLAKEALFSRLGPQGARAGGAPAWLQPSLHLYLLAQDLHERTSSSHAPYGELADSFFHSDVLYRCQRVLALLGQESVALATALRADRPWTMDASVERALGDLDSALSHLQSQGLADRQASGWPALQLLARNLRGMAQALAQALQPSAAGDDLSLFDRQVRTPREAWDRLRAQLHLASPLMRHAIRLSLALVMGFGLVWLQGDRHGFWILLTIVFVCQPRYDATLTRLAQRVLGTVVGLVVGWALLRLFPQGAVLGWFTVVAGVIFFATRQSRYLVASAAVTSLVLLSFSQVGDGFGLIWPRLLDTVAGSAIAGLAVGFILPHWQSRQLHRVAAQALRSQARYLEAAMAQHLSGKRDHLAYRLARRNAHNADAAFSSALRAVFQEPAHLRRHAGAGVRCLELSHTLLNYLSALGAHRGMARSVGADGPEAQAAQGLQQALEGLADALEQRQPEAVPLRDDPTVGWVGEAVAGDALRAQLHRAWQLLPELTQQAAGLAAGKAGKSGADRAMPSAPRG